MSILAILTLVVAGLILIWRSWGIAVCFHRHKHNRCPACGFQSSVHGEQCRDCGFNRPFRSVILKRILLLPFVLAATWFLFASSELLFRGRPYGLPHIIEDHLLAFATSDAIDERFFKHQIDLLNNDKAPSVRRQNRILKVVSPRLDELIDARRAFGILDMLRQDPSLPRIPTERERETVARFIHSEEWTLAGESAVYLLVAYATMSDDESDALLAYILEPHPSEDLRRAAAQAIANRESAPCRTFAVIANRLRPNAPESALHDYLAAVKHAAACNPPDDLLDTLLGLADHEFYLVRYRAIEAAVSLWPESESVHEMLYRAQSDPDNWVAEEATKYLDRLE